VSNGNRHDVIFHALAGKEYVKARRWYAKEGGGQLAERFCGEVDEAVERIAKNPTSPPTFRKAYHWVQLKRFPYVLYYHVFDDLRVIVLAVAHGLVDPVIG
jgi:plasmid stabilization system protein ParE